MPAQPRLGAPPDFSAELGALRLGARQVAGVDEVGRGALAGPVVAAAVVLPITVEIQSRLRGVRDSKQLSAAARGRLDVVIRSAALATAVAEVGAETIDDLGISRAVALAMRGALDALSVSVDFTLVDGRPVRELGYPHRAIVRGDASVLSIAAASIVAKVHRDALMTQIDLECPGYGFGVHKGYGTARHLRSIQQLGASAMHRRTWRPFQDSYPFHAWPEISADLPSEVQPLVQGPRARR